MRNEDLIAFASRDWQAIAALKRQRWAEQKSRMQPGEALRVGDALRQHVNRIRDGWPTHEDRQSDLAVHIRVSENLRRVVRWPDSR